MQDKSFSNKYIDLTGLIQEEFNRNVDIHGDKIKCREGCSQCCSQIFRITKIDAEIIRNHLSNMDTELQMLLKSKAENYIKVSDHSDIHSEEFYNRPKTPCPALDGNGSCLIYEARPVICRRFGPPVYDYKNPGKLHACELNFKEGEEIIDDLLIPKQTEIGKYWDELKTSYNTQNHLNKNASATIAEALLNI